MKKIIVVDRIRQQLDFEISPECGEVETITAYSNEGALIVHQKKKADLIITELYGSGMKAVQLCSAIREDPDLRKVSVIVFCRDNEIELRESRQCRANAVMTLPVQSRLLRSTLQRFLMVPERADYRLPFTARSARPKRRWTQSRSRKRLARNASVAPMLEANDTIAVPPARPKTAPAMSVMSAAPGNDRPVTAPYTTK